MSRQQCALLTSSARQSCERTKIPRRWPTMPNCRDRRTESMMLAEEQRQWKSRPVTVVLTNPATKVFGVDASSVLLQPPIREKKLAIM